MNSKIYKIIYCLSFILFIIFSLCLFFCNIVPEKYLIIILSFSLVIYLLCMFLTFNKSIKKKIKIACSIFLIFISIIFCMGIKYLSDTYSFLDSIDNKMVQKNNYCVMVPEYSNYKKIKDLTSKKIGIYSNHNSELAFNLISEKVNIIKIEYNDIEEMFDDLKNKKIDSILINDSMKSLAEHEILDFDIKLRCIKKVSLLIEQDDIVKITDITKKKFNVYIAGGDGYGNIANITNTDVNMIATIDPINNKILLTSIPRDYYVNLPSFGEDAYDKLTHAGYYGIDVSVRTIENLLDIDINYYIKVNFSTAIGFIDAIGGVDVESDYSFYALGSLYVRKGINHFNGREAVIFSRDRKSFSDGDVQRVKNEQKVVSAVVEKTSSSTLIISSFPNILNNLKDSISTNIDSKSLNKFIKKQLNDLKGWTIESQNLIGTDLYTKNTYTFPTMTLYVMVQDYDSVNECSKNIKEFLNN